MKLINRVLNKYWKEIGYAHDEHFASTGRRYKHYTNVVDLGAMHVVIFEWGIRCDSKGELSMWDALIVLAGVPIFWFWWHVLKPIWDATVNKIVVYAAIKFLEAGGR